MGLFDRFKKVIEPNIIIDSVNEKFLFYVDDIVPSFISFLRRLDDVEERTFAARSRLSGNLALFQDEYSKIAGELCTEDLLKRGCLKSCGNPTVYGHINKGCDLEVVMRSAKQASLILYNDRSKSYLRTYRFVFKSIDDTWKLCSVSSRLGDNDSWHIDHI